jgi:hypothetical protein
MEKMRLRDHVPVPIFADAAVGIYTAHGNLRLQLAWVHSNYSEAQFVHERVPGWTLVMPIAAAEEMATAILAHIEGMRKEAARQRAAAKATRN